MNVTTPSGATEDEYPLDRGAVHQDAAGHGTPATGLRHRPGRAPATMRAVVQDVYGPPEVLALTASEPVPEPGEHQVRVRVAASSVNARDWHIMRGEPRLARLLDKNVFGRKGPRVRTRGTDFVGTVDAVGGHVTAWRPGDAVFGEADAAWAEYVVAAADRIAEVPTSVTGHEAAALPLAGTTALTCLEAVEPGRGARVLINGASGGVGTLAIQIARSRGCHVTAVCSLRNHEQARRLGAAEVVDYRVDDFCARRDRYDVVVDLVGNRSLRALRRLVLPSGTLVLSGGGVPGRGRVVGALGLILRAQFLARTPGPRIVVPEARPDTERLRELRSMVEAGRLRPIIDRVYPLDRADDAVRHVEGEHARGKVIVAVSGPDASR